MENEPGEEEQPKRYYVEFNGNRQILGPDNTIPYIHTADTKYDHFYVQLEDDEDGEQQGHYEWRETYRLLGKEGEFIEKINNLIKIGCIPILKQHVSNFDREQFEAKFGVDPEPKEVKVPTVELTERMENIIRFAAYILLHEHLSADDFKGEGDLFI